PAQRDPDRWLCDRGVAAGDAGSLRGDGLRGLSAAAGDRSTTGAGCGAVRDWPAGAGPGRTSGRNRAGRGAGRGNGDRSDGSLTALRSGRVRLKDDGGCTGHSRPDGTSGLLAAGAAGGQDGSAGGDTVGVGGRTAGGGRRAAGGELVGGLPPGSDVVR